MHDKFIKLLEDWIVPLIMVAGIIWAIVYVCNL